MNTALRSAVGIRGEMRQPPALPGTLAGWCVAGLSVFHAAGKTALARAVVDELLAVSALRFLFCTQAMFFCLRSRRPGRARPPRASGRRLFLPGLAGMATSGMLMVYTLV